MRASSKAIVCGLSVLMLLTSATVLAGDVYHWVDEDGVAHYSQWPPQEGEQETTRIGLSRSGMGDYDPTEDPYSVLNQAQRIHAFWTQLRQRREAEQQEKAERVASSIPPYREHDPYIVHRVYAPYYLPVRPDRYRGRKIRRNQLRRLDETGYFDARRPYSINSSMHRARVQASASIPDRPSRR